MQIIDPVRVRRNYIQKLGESQPKSSLLLCPVREREWAEGWDPLAVILLRVCRKQLHFYNGRRKSRIHLGNHRI